MATSLNGMLLGRLLVGVGMGIGPPVASLYVVEVCILNCIEHWMYNNRMVMVSSDNRSFICYE